MKTCHTCNAPLGKRNTTGFCKAHLKRCSACGRFVPPDTNHDCSSVDLHGERKCVQCGTSLENTGWQRWSKWCRRCSRKRRTTYEKDRRQQLREQFGNKCEICGYNTCDAALQFHHTDSSEKYDWNYKGHGGASTNEIIQHPERFQLLCVRCHVELHLPNRTR